MNSKKGKGSNPQTSKIQRPNEYIDSKKIEESFKALKNACTLSKAEIETGPLFSNKQATLYLHITPKNMRKKGIPTKLLLEHALSYKRSVCFIAKHMDKPAQAGYIVQILKDTGIIGKIKPIPLSLLKLAVQEKNFEALDELATLYDTHFVAENINMSEVADALNRQRKRVVLVNLQPGLQKDGFHVGLATTLVCTTAGGKSIDFRVAHVGMTVQQVVENVHTTLVQIISKAFPDGISSFDSVRLKSGDRDADAYDLYLDGDCPQTKLKVENEEKKAASTSILKKTENAKKLKEIGKPQIPQIPQDQYGVLRLADGLSSLKSLLGWTGAAGAAEPRYTDKQATVYLRLRLLTKIPLNCNDLQTISLTHPLSFKRRVCLVVPWNAPEVGSPDDPNDDELKDTFKEIGVKGFVQIVHQDNIPDAKQELEKLVELTDTVVVDVSVVAQCGPLRAVLRDAGKALASLDLSSAEGREERLGAALRRSAIGVANERYEVMVGHTGMTHGQLSENLAFALAELRTLPLMPEKLEQYESIVLENGLGVGAPVYLNNIKVTRPVAQSKKSSHESAEEDFTKSQHPDLIVTKWDYRRKGEGGDFQNSRNGPEQGTFSKSQHPDFVTNFDSRQKRKGCQDGRNGPKRARSGR